MKLRNLLLILIMTGAATAASAQPLLKGIAAWAAASPREQLHVHFDKGSYNPGETVWFKAYLQSNGEASPLSSTIVAELRDAKGGLLIRHYFPVFESTAAGQLSLPLSLATGAYSFRVYTPWMVATDSLQVYDALLAVGTSIPSGTAATTDGTQLRAFPEGGSLLAGFPASVALQAQAGDGRPAKVAGTIRDAKGKAVANFTTGADGLGAASFEPQAGTAYTAEWRDAKGTIQKSQLPAVSTSGATLQVQPGRRDILFQVRRTADQPSRLHLVGILHQQLVYHASLDMQDLNVTSGMIKQSQLATGVLQLALFDDQWRPLSERAVFVDGDVAPDLHVRLRVPVRSLAPRGRNVIEIEVTDTLKTSLSLSVTDAGIAAHPASIGSMAFADGARKPADAVLYFYDRPDSAEQATDLRLLVLQPAHPSWETFAQGFADRQLLPPYLAINGTVRGVNRNQNTGPVQLNLVFQPKGGPASVFVADVDKNGRFSVPGQLFFDTAAVYYSFNRNPRLDQVATVQFDQPLAVVPVAGLPSPVLPALPVDERSRFFAAKQSSYRVQYEKRLGELENVIVRGRARSRQDELEKGRVSGMFNAGYSRNFILEDDPAAQGGRNVLEYLRARVPGLMVQQNGVDYTVTRRGSDVALFLDEFNSDPERLASLSIGDISFVKVFDPPFFGAAGGGAGGAIAVYTRRGGGRSSAGPGLSKGKLIGYSPILAFPDAPAKEDPAATLEDVRSTLLWRPFLLTEKGKQVIRIEFQNNDISNAFRIVLEGMNEAGQTVHLEQVVR